MSRATAFTVSHFKRNSFSRRGLRGYFEYRDLGIQRATRGKVVAHVIRARPARAPHGEWHWHDCDLQFVYVLKGWALFEYEGDDRDRLAGGVQDLLFGGTRSQKVTGPSFTRLTFMCAPKRPVATRGTTSPAF